VLALLAALIASALALFRLTFGISEDLPLRALFGAGEPTLRAVGTFTNSNYYGMFAAVAAVMMASLAVRTGGLVRVAWLVGTVVSVAGVVASFSRGALLALGVGLVIVAFQRGRRTGIAAMVAIAIGGAVLIPAFVDTRLEITTGGIYALPTAELAASDATRSDAFLTGLRMFIENPLAGVGFGQFRFHAQDYIGSNTTTYPHSTWTKLLAEQGLIGFVVFGALVLVGVWMMRKRQHPWLPVVGVGAITYAIAGTFLEPLISLQTSGLIWISLAAVLADPSPAPATERPARRGASPAVPATPARSTKRPTAAPVGG
jgi:O-antigen ligase